MARVISASGGKRARRIVHQYEVRPMPLQCLQTGADGCLPGRTAVHRGQQVEALDRRPEEGGIIAVDDRLDRGDALYAPPRPQGSAGLPARPECAGIAWARCLRRGARDRQRRQQRRPSLSCPAIPNTPCGATALARPVPAANRGFVLHFRIFSPPGDFFAVQHLRIGRDWLNSMQSEIVAYFVCMDDK